MNKRNLFGVIVVAIAMMGVMTLSSCSHDDYVYNADRAEKTAKENYAKAFEKSFGTVGPNVDWGFSSKSASARATRAKGDYGHGSLQPSISFPDDCDASVFTPNLEGIPSYEDYLISKGTQWWHPEEINDGGVVYIDKVQPIKISGGTDDAHAKLYITAGEYDFTNVQFDLNKFTDLYLLEGAVVTLGNTVAANAIFDTYIAPGAELIVNGDKGLVANSGISVYNHGTMTCSKVEVNTNSILYNVGTLTTDSVKVESNGSRIVNDATINAATVVVKAGAVQNNAEWNVTGTTVVTSNNSGWVNNGHWTTENYAYTGGSENVINNCFLEVKKDFDINLSSANGMFKLDANCGVLTENFNGGTDKFTGAISGPFRIEMGQKSLFKVTGTAVMESGRSDTDVDGFGIYGPTTGEYAVFQAKNIVRKESIANTWGAVTYSGNLYVSAETHFAQGDDGVAQHKFITEKNGFRIDTNIFAEGFQPDAPDVEIDETPCCPGFKGKKPLYRVIAEDLSASEAGDFDFNDVVFDVVKAENGETTLNLICAGGVLPLRVRGANQPEGVEIHGVFGEKTPNAKGEYKMYNTNAGPTVPVTPFKIEGEYTTPEEIRNIIIEVKKNNTWMVLDATRGRAACKILVDDTFIPVTEGRNIANEYQLFTNYVQGKFLDDFWWEMKK